MSRIIKCTGLLVIAILTSGWGFAQNIKGTVRDSTGKSVPYASVNLKNTATQVIISYTISDAKGSYILQTPANVMLNGLVVEVQCLGYKTTSKYITGIQQPVDFILPASANQLQDVVIKSSRPLLRTNGDTLSYKVAQFSNAQDRVIGDVIKRLPGITVSPDGTIRYNNKPISNLYIGGDDLLGDRYSIATTTVPQGAVDQVQVIENNQPVKVLQNKVMSNDVALNLTFTKGAKLRVVGQESVGGGLPGNYDVSLNAMMFKDKYKAVNYLQANNTGDGLQQNLAAHNLSDYLQRIDNDVPATMLSLGAVNTPALSPSRYLFNQSGVINLNNLFNLKKNAQLKVNAWYYHDNQRQDYSQKTTIFLPGDTVRYNETQHNRFKPGMMHAQFTLNINRSAYYLNDVLIMDNNRASSQSGLATNGTTVNQVFNNNMLEFSNEFGMIKSSKSSRTIQAYSYISHTSKPERRTIGPGYNAAIFNDSISYSQLVQNVDMPTWFTNNYISFQIPSNLFTQSFKAGFDVQSQNLTSTLNIVQANNKVTPESDSSMNYLNWLRKKVYAEADYDVVGSTFKASLVLPISLQQINYSDNRYALNKGLTRLYFNPQLNVKYQTGIENYLTLRYSYRNQTGTIEDIYQGYILKDYRTLYANNAALAERQNQLALLGFNYRKALKLLFFSINVLYNHTRANNIASSIITNNLQQGIALPYPNSINSWAITGSASKYAFALHTTFSAAFEWQQSHLIQIQNNVLLPFNTASVTITFGAETRLNTRLNFSYHATSTQTDSHSPAAVSADHIYQLVQQAATWYNPSTNLQFKLSGDHYFTRRRGNAALAYFFADASVKYHITRWRTDLQLDAANLLNVKTYDAFYLATNSLTNSSFKLPGRVILLKFLFNL